MKILWPTAELHRGDNQPAAVTVLSSVLARAGFHSEVVEADAARIVSAVDKDEPAALSFSCTTAYADEYVELSRQVKAQRPVFSIFGGPHPTFFPEMIEEEGVDAVCVGEGEGAIIDVATNLSEGRPIDGILNLHAKANGQIIKNPVRQLIEDLDSLPIPDHDVFHKLVPKHFWRTYVQTSRGCPYRCSYCFNEHLRTLCRGKGRWLRPR